MKPRPITGKVHEGFFFGVLLIVLYLTAQAYLDGMCTDLNITLPIISHSSECMLMFLFLLEGRPDLQGDKKNSFWGFSNLIATEGNAQDVLNVFSFSVVYIDVIVIPAYSYTNLYHNFIAI